MSLTGANLWQPCLVMVALALMVTAGGCRSYEQDPYPGNEAAWSVPKDGPYRIFPGDLVHLVFEYHPEWNVQVRVREDGRASVPYLGEVEAAGRTLQELDDFLEENLAKEIKEPQLRLDIAEHGDREIYVGGEVGEPGVVTFGTDRVTLLEAIVKAGGFLKESADLSTVIVVREDERGVRHAWKVNLDPILTANVPPQPVILRHRDVILVPNTAVDQANIFVDKYITRMIPGGPALAALFLLGSSR